MTIVSYSEKKKKGKRRSSRRNSLRLFSRAPPIVQRKTRSRDCSQLLKNDASFSPSSKKQWHWTKKKKAKRKKKMSSSFNYTERWQNVEQPTEMTVSELKQPRIACETSDCDNVTRLSSSRWLHWNVMQRSFLHLGINTRSEFRATVPRSVKRKKRDPL